MVTSFWSKVYAVTWRTNCESLGEHPMWMFFHLFSLVAQPGHWYWLGTCCMLAYGALAGHMPCQAFAMPLVYYYDDTIS